MTNDRVYRRRLSVDDALAEIAAASGTEFAPEAVGALLEEYAPLEARLAS